MGDHEADKTPLLNDRTYDLFGNIVRLFIPALGVFYATIAEIWDIPQADRVVGTLAAVGLLLGVILQISKSQYKKTEADKDGVIDVFPTNKGAELGRMSLNLSADDIAGKQLLTLKVNNLDSSSQ